MKLIITTHSYNYFGGASKETNKVYDNLLEGWMAYKAQCKHDFRYDDAYQYTTYRTCTTYPATTAVQRPHARTAYEWERMQEEKKQRDAMDALTKLLGHTPAPVEVWDCNDALAEEMFADMEKDLWDSLLYDEDECARKEEDRIVASVVLAEGWSERLHLLSRHKDSDPVAVRAVTALCNHLGCRVVYVAGPEYVMYDGEKVFGYAYSLYADGELVAHCEEC